MKYWPHQESAHRDAQALYRAHKCRWVMVAPCGAGKSVMMQRIAIPAAKAGKRVAVYSYRVLLTQQLLDGFRKAGADTGVVASGFKADERPNAPIQICSLQTIHARLGNFRFAFPHADIVIVDEAHQQTGAMAQEVFRKHIEQGARCIGFTATPVDVGGMYDELVSAGTYSEMLECNAHLPIRCYGPDRPDLSKVRAMKGGDFSSNVDRKINRVPSIIGYVYDYWKKLNPDGLPAIGFAPGVAESKWFVNEFQLRGVDCAHIDAERVVMVENGIQKEYPADESSREAVIQGSREGRFKIVWNRFVLREAIDMPWLYQAIAATSMGALSTYLQSVGRVQRYWPEYDHVVLQDHGGNIDRHGPPDLDRDWVLGDSNNTMHRKEVERRQKEKGDEAEPICCPNCCAYRTHGPKCHECGYMHKRSVKMVRQIDGELVRKVGRDVKYKAPKAFDDLFRSALFGAYATGQTVKQAFAVARMRAKQSGVDPVPGGKIFVPKKGDPLWDRSVRHVYPNMKPKHMRAS